MHKFDYTMCRRLMFFSAWLYTTLFHPSYPQSANALNDLMNLEGERGPLRGFKPVVDDVVSYLDKVRMYGYYHHYHHAWWLTSIHLYMSLFNYTCINNSDFSIGQIKEGKGPNDKQMRALIFSMLVPLGGDQVQKVGLVCSSKMYLPVCPQKLRCGVCLCFDAVQ